MFKKVFDTTKKFVQANDRNMLTGVVVGGVVATLYLTYRSTKKYIEKKPEIDAIETPKKKYIEIGKIAAPAVAAAGVTIGAAIVEKKVGDKKIEDLMEKVAFATTVATGAKRGMDMAQTYADKLEEQLSDAPEKIENAKKEALKADLNKDVDEKGEPLVPIINTGKGNQLFKLQFSGDYFRSNKNFVDSVLYKADKALHQDGSLLYNYGWLKADLGMSSNPEDNHFKWSIKDQFDYTANITWPEHLQTPIHDSCFNESVYIIQFETDPEYTG